VEFGGKKDCSWKERDSQKISDSSESAAWESDCDWEIEVRRDASRDNTLDPGRVFSVFSVLISIHALDKRISEQENRLPLIVLGTSDEEIFVRGLRIAASHLRRAADGALCEAQRLQEELLLGWPASALVLESVRDDLTNASLGYSIKADATEMEPIADHADWQWKDHAVVAERSAQARQDQYCRGAHHQPPR